MRAESLDLRKLKAFQLTAKHGGLRVAAAQLGLTVPAVSFQVRRLEEDLRVELFQRSATGLVLTPAGEDLLSEATAIFDRVDSALLKLTSDDVVRGRLSVSTSSDVVWYFAPRISNFLKRHPGVQLRHHVYNGVQTLQLVRSGEIDVGIGYFPKLPASLEKTTIAESSLSLLCGVASPLIGRRAPKAIDLAGHRLILPPARSSTRKIVDAAFARSKVKVRDVIEVGSCQAARNFAENGVGIAVVHTLCVSQGMAAGLRRIDVGSEFGQVDFSAVYRRGSAQTPIVRGLLAQLTREIDE